MAKTQRQNEITEILEERGFMTAKKLAERLSVSLPTVRRDLAELAYENRVIRCRGGAKIADDGHALLPLEYRQTQKAKEKKELCRAVAELIADGDVIFLDSSTTFFPLASFLRERASVTVITDGLQTAMLLRRAGVRTFCTGGELSDITFSMSGQGAEKIFERFTLDTAIFSSHGVDENGDIVGRNEGLSALRREAMKRVRKTIFVCDGEKFGVRAPYRICHITDVDHIVTNLPIPESFGVPDGRVLLAGKPSDNNKKS